MLANVQWISWKGGYRDTIEETASSDKKELSVKLSIAYHNGKSTANQHFRRLGVFTHIWFSLLQAHAYDLPTHDVITK